MRDAFGNIIDQKILFADLIIDLRRRPTNTTEVRLVLVFGASRPGYISIQFDITGAYLWTRADELSKRDIDIFLDADSTLRESIFRLTNWQHACDHSYLFPKLGGIYGGACVGDLWSDLAFRVLQHLGWEPLLENSESLYVFQEEGHVIGLCAIYTDDGTCSGRPDIIEKLRENLKHYFEVREWDSFDQSTRMLSVHYQICEETPHSKPVSYTHLTLPTILLV